METPPNKLRQNLVELKEQIMIIGNDEIIEFLNKCNRQFIQILHNKYEDNEIGGMIKQKLKRK